jgi:hypothetical protein
MGPRRRLIALALAQALVASACSSCKRKPDEAPKAEAAPPDHLAPGELVEGSERAFGLPLPRASRVAARFADSAHVTSTATPEQLANFVRTRVKEGTVTQGTTSTKVENAIPRDDKNKRISIEVRSLRSGNGNRSEMVIRDTTPPPFDPSLTEDQRWEKAGITPTGKLIDPKHLE